MIELEDRLSDLFTRTADAVEVRPDIDRVLDGGSVIPLSGPRRRRWPVVVAGAAAVAGVVVGALVLTDRDGPAVEVTTPPVGQTETPPADAVPRFLVTAPGWEVTWIEEFSGDEYGGDVGETTITDGSGRSLALNWYPADQYGDFLDDRQTDAEATSQITIDGHDALLFEGGSIREAWWLQGDNAFELRGDNFPSLDEFRAVAATVREVDQDTWLAALPDDVLRPDDRAAAVAATLADLPLPEGLDVDAVASTGTANDPYIVKLEAVDAVICGWVQQWVDGTEAGDAAAVAEAVAAMASSHEWPPLVEAAGGPWTDYVWDVADAMVANVPLEQNPSIPQGPPTSATSAARNLRDEMVGEQPRRHADSPEPEFKGPGRVVGYASRSSQARTVSVVHVATPVPRKSLSLVQMAPPTASATATTGQSSGSRAERHRASVSSGRYTGSVTRIRLASIAA